MRPLIDLAYRLRRLALRWLRWRTRGVKVLVFDKDGRVLLIRNRYGDRNAWLLPGGGVGRREVPELAAHREVAEEVGCRLRSLAAVAVFRSEVEGKRDTIYLFRGVTGDEPAHDGVEVAEASFFAADDLPVGTSPATRRRIDEVAGRRSRTDLW